MKLECIPDYLTEWFREMEKKNREQKEMSRLNRAKTLHTAVHTERTEHSKRKWCGKANISLLMEIEISFPPDSFSIFLAFLFLFLICFVFFFFFIISLLLGCNWMYKMQHICISYGERIVDFKHNSKFQIVNRVNELNQWKCLTKSYKRIWIFREIAFTGHQRHFCMLDGLYASE